MTDKLHLSLWEPVQAHKQLAKAWLWVKSMLMAGHRLDVAISSATRSTAQNARLWAMLADVSDQVIWYGEKLNKDEWKHVFTAAYKKSKVVPGIDGGFVVCGIPTSKMTIEHMSELQVLIEAFGADKGVKFRAPDNE